MSGQEFDKGPKPEQPVSQAAADLSKETGVPVGLSNNLQKLVWAVRGDSGQLHNVAAALLPGIVEALPQPSPEFQAALVAGYRNTNSNS